MLVIGHRGASESEAENSPAAFRRAEEMGADGVELDVRLSPWGELVVHHDPIPADATPTSGPATFRDVLDACGSMLVNVEIKNEVGDESFTARLVDAVAAELGRRGSDDRWLISSFSETTLVRCRAVAPHLATALLVVSVDRDVVTATAGAGHSALHPHESSVTAEVVEWCAAERLAVNVWTCNDEARIRELADLGVDGVCTDAPDRALAALGRTADLSRPRPAWGTPA